MEPFESDDTFRELFASEKAAAEAEAQLPAAEFLYWKALEAERQKARARALRPIVWVERLSLVAIAAGIAVAVALFTPQISWAGIDFPTIAPITAGIMLGVSLPPPSFRIANKNLRNVYLGSFGWPEGLERPLKPWAAYYVE